MLPDVGASELLVIAAVALIVVGPKDLPVLLRKLGRLTAKLRGLAADFRASFDEMGRQAELDELRKEVEALRSNSVGADIKASIGADAESMFSDLDNELRGVLTAPADPPPSEPADEAEAAPEPAPEIAPPAPEPQAAAGAEPKP